MQVALVIVEGPLIAKGLQVSRILDHLLVQGIQVLVRYNILDDYKPIGVQTSDSELEVARREEFVAHLGLRGADDERVSWLRLACK